MAFLEVPDSVTPHPGGDPRWYVGESTQFGRRVVVQRRQGRVLLPYVSERSGSGFAWARGGPGARDLAQSILDDATESPALAARLCRDFTWDVIRELPAEGFALSRLEVLDWVGRRV
jgi:hypothetical protein